MSSKLVLCSLGMFSTVNWLGIESTGRLGWRMTAHLYHEVRLNPGTPLNTAMQASHPEDLGPFQRYTWNV